jgi:hypothetical protein
VRALGLILLVAACNPDGLTIEVVVDDPAMVKVELYAGGSCGDECPRITAPPGLPPMGVDSAFVVNDPQVFTVEQQDFSDGVAGFRIESPQDTSLAIIAVVGYNAQNEIKWSWSRQYVEIPSNNSAYWQVHLDPTTKIDTVLAPQPAGTERAAQWPNPKGGPACLLLEHWGYNFIPERELLGPANDRDCDGVAEATECAPWIPNAAGAAPTIDETSCVTPTPINGTYVCMLGGPECTENPTLPREMCVPVEPNYCTPSSICQCKGLLDPRPCIKEQIAMGIAAHTMPFVKCVIHVDGSGNRCDSSDLEIDLGSAVSSGGSRTCRGMAFNDADPELQFNYAWHIGEAKLYIDSFTTPCKASVKWEGGATPTLINVGLLDIELDNDYHLLMPVVADIAPGCESGAASSCQFMATTSTFETMFACVGAAPTMSACSPDPNGLCPTGPMCNGLCCPVGEVCGPEGCSCNGGDTCTGGDHCESGGAQGEFACGQVCCGVTTLCPL